MEKNDGGTAAALVQRHAVLRHGIPCDPPCARAGGGVGGVCHCVGIQQKEAFSRVAILRL